MKRRILLLTCLPLLLPARLAAAPPAVQLLVELRWVDSRLAPAAVAAVRDRRKPSLCLAASARSASAAIARAIPDADPMSCALWFSMVVAGPWVELSRAAASGGRSSPPVLARLAAAAIGSGVPVAVLSWPLMITSEAESARIPVLAPVPARFSANSSEIWWAKIDPRAAMPVTTGRSTTLVASRRPPMPTSSTNASAGVRAKARKATAAVTSKKLGPMSPAASSTSLSRWLSSEA